MQWTQWLDQDWNPARYLNTRQRRFPKVRIVVPVSTWCTGMPISYGTYVPTVVKHCLNPWLGTSWTMWSIWHTYTGLMLLLLRPSLPCCLPLAPDRCPMTVPYIWLLFLPGWVLMTWPILVSEVDFHVPSVVYPMGNCGSSLNICLISSGVPSIFPFEWSPSQFACCCLLLRISLF